MVMWMMQEDGSYAGFDDQEYTARSGGKCKAIMHIKVHTWPNILGRLETSFVESC